MLNLFEELKCIGFKELDQVTLYPPKLQVTENLLNSPDKQLTLEDILYDKSYTCPVCGNQFKSKAIRSGKNRLLTVELDLKANYERVNPLLYECVVCEKCGYAAIGRNFNQVSTRQIQWIKEQICSRYTPYHYSSLLSEEEAVMRYKLALLNAFVKKAKDGEKGYICLKLAWLYRDMKETSKEMTFMEQALIGLENAYNSEHFPIFELGELTTAYIIANLYRNMGKYDQAMRWIGYVIMDASVSLRLKTKALHLKGIIVEERKKR